MIPIFLKIYAYLVARKVDKWSSSPIQYQKALFQKILKKTNTSRYRKELNLTNINTYEEFRNLVPLQNYENLKKYVDRISKGEQNVLSKNKPIYLIMTSGTTSGKKYIPTTKSGMNLYLNGIRDSVFYYVYVHKKFNILDGKILTFSGSPVLSKIGQITSGRVSSVLSNKIPWYFSFYRLPNRKSNSISDWTEKVESIIEESIKTDVRIITGLPIWIQNYFDGILARGHESVLDVFPNLQLFVHGGLSIKPYINHLHKLIHNTTKIDFIEVYNASEGFFAFQNDVNDEGLLLHLNSGIFYEFMTVNSNQSNEKTRIPLWEVEVDQEYEMIISTYSGVLAYCTDDTIKFNSTKPYKIVWTGRKQQFTSAFNEHVIAEEVESAVYQAVKNTSMDLIEFTVAPTVNVEGSDSFYDWHIEFGENYKDEKLKDFAQELDDYIKSKNHVYRELRQANILKNPRITQIQKNGFYNYMQGENKLGDQYKVVHLANDRNIVNKLSEWAV